MRSDHGRRSPAARWIAAGVTALGSVIVAEMASDPVVAAAPTGHARAVVAATASPWVVQAVPQPSVPNGDLISVSCSTATTCEAVGDYQNSTPSLGTLSTGVPLAESWNGVTWKAQDPAVPSGGTESSLDAVSCASPHFCEAVGSLLTDDFSTVPIAEEWTGTTWKLQKLSGGSSQAVLDAVSCATTKSCEAVGSESFHWNGATWKAQSLASSKALTGPTLGAVSCKAAASCEALGSASSSSNVQQPLAEQWNGTGWKIQAASTPKGDPEGRSLPGHAARPPCAKQWAHM